LEKKYNYNVKSVIPNNVSGYKHLTISDTLDSRLDVVGTKVQVDGKDTEFEAVINGQNVTLTLDRKDLNGLEGKEVNVVITAKIKDGTPIELIENKATIQLNNQPVSDSNVVTVIPPTPVQPEINKDVEGKDHIEVEKEKNYNYNVKTVVPTTVEGYKHLTIEDTLDTRLDIVEAKVFVDGKESKLEA
ncbi:isopeptide-forming domain-containing fimbrial protein, partial [Bacillus cereus]|uniref:isopeptide-forming domain-containing fimbrial protein n=1 Tax=Bacillus cereus TaxID=1396 RepID=UPI003D1722F9